MLLLDWVLQYVRRGFQNFLFIYVEYSNITMLKQHLLVRIG